MRPLVALLLFVPMLAGCVTEDSAPDTAIDPTAAAGGFTDTTVYPGEYDTSQDWSVVLSPGPLTKLPGEVFNVASALDGVNIHVGVVRPDTDEPVPVVVLASPYLPTLTPDGITDGFYERLVDNFVPHGYAVAFVAVRGTSSSGGCSDLFGPLETHDLDQAITFLGEAEWSNGAVGMVGVSYDGSTPWIVAGQGNPYLKTIIPISGLSDVFNLEFRNGTTEQRMLGLVSALYYGYGFLFNNPATGRSAGQTVEGIVCPAAWQGIHASMESAVTGERDTMGYWEERNHRPGVEANYNGSILLIHGLQDWNVDPHHAYPWVSQLDAQGKEVKHFLGQWGHAWPDGWYLDDGQRRFDFAEMLLNWFNYYLKDDRTADLGPRAQVQDSLGRWRNEDTWPPADAQETTLYLAPGGRLVTEPTDGTESVPVGPDESMAFGRPATFLPGTCQACAIFIGDELGEDFHAVGLPKVHVTVTPSAPSGHLAAFLYSVTPAGEGAWEWDWMGWTQMDLRFAEGGETAKPIVPGQPVVAKLQLEPLDAVAPAGSRLALVFSQGTQHDRTPVVPSGPLLLEVGSDVSTFTPSVIDRNGSDFFDVPT